MNFQTRFKRKQSGTQYRTFLQVLHIDMPLLLGILVLSCFGFVILYSASNAQVGMVVQELMHMGLAFGIMFLLAQLPPSFYRRWAVFIYTLGIVMLLAVLVIGKIKMGAQRWLNLGFFRFQPSEMMRIAVPMMLASYFTHRELPPSWRDLLICAVLVFVPAVLTLKEPDLGTAIMLVLGGGCVLLFAGIRWRVLILLLIVLMILAPIAWHYLHTYQQQRILTFFSPERDPLGAGYHIIQSKIAIGSGGVFGKGFLQGIQSRLHFLPEHATDFIFAVFAEEFGLIGAFLLVVVYFYITLRALYIGQQAQDTFSRLLASSLALMFFISVFINMGMVTGLVPVVGLPLPLVSYGGSSMITHMASFGILMSIHCHRTLLSK